jgi:hypothetical protein
MGHKKLWAGIWKSKLHDWMKMLLWRVATGIFTIEALIGEILEYGE